MDIERLSLQTNDEILALLALQMAAYRVEAELIGFDDLPPLKEGVASICESEESFYGYYVNENESRTLVGVISFEREGSMATICRLMVHPNYFRRGVARALLQHTLANQQQNGASRFIVSTSTDNLPAIQLYESFGFARTKEFTAPPEVRLTMFERSALLKEY